MKNPNPAVLHLIGGGEFGGAEQHIVTLLPRLQKCGIQPLLGCLYNRSPLAEKIREETTIPTELFPMRTPFDLSPLPHLLKFCTQHEVHLLHCHGLRADILGRTAARLRRIPSISTWHSWPENDFPNTLTGKIGMMLEQMTVGLSAGSITVSNALRERLENWPPVQSRIRHKKNHLSQTIYNGYIPCERTLDEDKQARNYYRDLWGISDTALVLGSVGRLHPVKGHRTLLDAANLLAPHYPHLHILLIGDGPERPSLEQQLKNVSYSYTFAGHLPDAERALPAIDVFVFPSLHEGMGIALLEAIQARLPIVASSVGGIPEILRAGIDALLVPASDPDALASACRRLLEDPLLRETLLKTAPERLALFHPDIMTDQTIDFYHRILQE